ncbi:MAG: type IV pilus secretin PilQ [Methylococcaceae bacterium]
MNKQHLLLALISGFCLGHANGFAASDGLIKKLDFKRTSRTESQLVIQFQDTRIPAVESLKKSRLLTVRIPHSALDESLIKTLDLKDFSTAVERVEIKQEHNDAQLDISLAADQYEYSIKPEENRLLISIRTGSGLSPAYGQSPRNPGGKISLDFQDIAVRSILQIMADFAAVNIIASDTVAGNLTLKLDDIPWEEALDIILKARNLGSTRTNNVIWVAPREDIRKSETDELEARQAVEDLEPLKTEIIPINYTTAEELKKVLIGTTKRTNTTLGQGKDIGGSSVNQSVSTLDQSESILSNRGNVTADNRTNQLIIKDTAYNLERIRELVRQLDKPVRQVLIESRIVIASNDFTRELGAKLSLDRPTSVNNDGQIQDTTGTNATGSGSTRNQTVNMLVDLASVAATGGGGTLGLTLLKAGDYLLDLELSAAQMEGRGEIISTPRLLTADHTKASIKQGVEIPYQIMSASGGGSVSNIQFKEAVLQLDVTPSITPDDHVLMQLTIKKDAQGQDTTAGPAIDKREIETTARVGNGETIVLGGVFEGTRGNTTRKIPFLGDIPGIGFMFRRNTVSDTRRELLIFITPKIMEKNT